MTLVQEFSPWSISKVDLAKKCPKAFAFRYIDKIKTASGTEARVGTAAHRSLELQLQGVQAVEAEATAVCEARDLTTEELEDLYSMRQNIEDYLVRIRRFREKYNVVYEGYEEKYGITLKGEPSGYDDPETFLRGSVDHLMLQDTGRAVIIDHKSGKLKTAADYAKQLDTYSILTVANVPQALGTYSGIHFLRYSLLDWHQHAQRDHVRRTLLPWLRGYIERVAAELGDYAAIPQRLCPWCDFIDRCEEGQNHCKVNKLTRKTRKKKA